MSRFRRFEIIEHPPSYYLKQTSISKPLTRTLMLNPFFPSPTIVEEELDYTLDLLNLTPTQSAFFVEFETITDLIQIDKAPLHPTSTRRAAVGDLHLHALRDRVSALELGLDRLAKEEKIKNEKKKTKEFGERRYTCTAEVKSPEVDRKYKWTAEIKDGKDEKKGLEKNYKWTAEIKRKGADGLPIEQTYTFKVSSGGKQEEEKKSKSERAKGKDKAVGSTSRIEEIKEPSDHGGIVMRQAFARRVEKRRGKKKELSAQDAASLIQMTFRAYLIRRSQALRALRELAVAKTKLKEIRACFHNYSYRHRLGRDAEERQKFSEKIIVLLLTVDAIEGADLMVRGAKRSIVDELEAILDVVDPQPAGKSLSMRRRTFDMPDNVINKELAAGVEQVVRMLDQDVNTSETFEACL